MGTKLQLSRSYNGLKEEEITKLKAYASPISGLHSRIANLDNRVATLLERISPYITTSEGMKNIEEVLNSYSTRKESYKRAALRLCDTKGCDSIVPYLYFGENARGKEVPVLAFYVFDRDLIQITYNITFFPEKVFFSRFNSDTQGVLSRLEEGIGSASLRDEIISEMRNVYNISSEYLSFLLIGKEGIEKEVTFCKNHEQSAPSEDSIIAKLRSSLHDKFSKIISPQEIKFDEVKSERKVIYSAQAINDGNAPQEFKIPRNYPRLKF